MRTELDVRHPERVQWHDVRSADDHRALWTRIEQLWTETLARASRLPEPLLHQRVDGEWSFVETLRHLVTAVDAWVSRTILDEAMPYHWLGLTPTEYPQEAAAAIGIRLEARPTFGEVLEVWRGRMTVVQWIVDGLTEAELGRICTRTPAPGYPEETRTVGECLRKLMHEEIEHRRYAVRDLAILEAACR